ncbi:MAG: DUF448 domain-containing protein [Actinobacteria bacterium]|nr:DUF448 domain-containing protein [Actinomycetota bacterium]
MRLDEGPIRSCVGCRTRRPKAHLIRVALGAGRGAYLCFDPRCVRRALKTGSLGRALRSQGPLPPELGDRLLTIANERRRDGQTEGA